MIAALSDAIGAGALLVGSVLVTILPFLPDSLATNPEQIMIVVGFGGQALFASRFIIQWLKSEGAKKSVIPVAFWYFSIGGGAVLLSLCHLASRPCYHVWSGSRAIYLCQKSIFHHPLC